MEAPPDSSATLSVSEILGTIFLAHDKKEEDKKLEEKERREEKLFLIILYPFCRFYYSEDIQGIFRGYSEDIQGIFRGSFLGFFIFLYLLFLFDSL